MSDTLHRDDGTRMKAETVDVFERGETTREVVPSVSIENMLRQREAVSSRFTEALRLMEEAKEICQAAHLGIPDVRLSSSGGRDRHGSDMGGAALLQAIDSPAWAYLLSESGLRSFMDAKARKEWDEQIHSGNVPPLTRENVEATFALMYATRGDMFERGVISIFRHLSWCYRTNQPFAFGKRIILTHLLTCYGPRKLNHSYLNHNTANELDDLMRVFMVLDGKPEADHRRGLYSQLSAAVQESCNTWANEYISIKLFLKGTGHVLFLRPDLVDRMNGILAKHYPGALPAPHP